MYHLCFIQKLHWRANNSSGGKSSLEGLCRLFIGYGFESTDHQYREFNDLLNFCSKLEARAVKISWVIALYFLSAYALVIQK